MNTKVNLSGWELDNPIIPASGTFGYGREFAALYDLDILGTFSFKGTTVEERFGNPTPRIADSYAGIVNSIGLQNPGVDHVIAYELPDMKSFFHKKVIANLSGATTEEYVTLAEKLGKEEQVGILEVNISCPNVRCGGMSVGTSPEKAMEVTKAVKAVAKKPVYMKLSPNVTDIVSIALACEEGGADGISMINTLAEADYRKQDCGLLGEGALSRGARHGVQGFCGGEDSDHRHRRSFVGGGRARNDDGGRNCGRRGRGKSD